MNEQAALDRYLAPPWVTAGGLTVKSSFWGALIDARNVTGRDGHTGAVLSPGETGTWLGAIGYLTFLDQVGTAVRPRRPGPPLEREPPIRRALRYFARPRLTPRDLDAVYALRNSLAHDFSLINNPRGRSRQHLRFWFTLTRESHAWLVRHAARRWQGVGDDRPSATTWVNLRHLGSVAEGVAARVLGMHSQGRLAVGAGVQTPDELVHLYTIVYRQ